MFAIPVSYNKAATLYIVQLDVCEAICFTFDAPDCNP